MIFQTDISISVQLYLYLSATVVKEFHPNKASNENRCNPAEINVNNFLTLRLFFARLFS